VAFPYQGAGIIAYYAPDNLFNSDDRPILIKDFKGEWKLTEAQCIEVIRRSLAKVNPPTNLVHMDFPPQVCKPAVPGIPRYMFRWDYVPEGGSFVVAAIDAEVDADKGELKSLFYGDLGFGKKKPPIDVPLSCHRHRKQTRLQRVLRRRQANRRVDSGRRFQNRTAGFIGP
jgi:hypothetical protein